MYVYVYLFTYLKDFYSTFPMPEHMAQGGAQFQKK